MISLILCLSACYKSNLPYDASGVFEAKEIIVSSEMTGKLIRFNVEEGQSCSQNQIVGQVDDLQLVLRKKQLLANIQAIKSRQPNISKQIAVLKQQLISVKKEKIRVEKLVKNQALPDKQLDDIIAQVEILEKQEDALKSSLTNNNKGLQDDIIALKFQLDQLNDMINKCKIINPIQGTVLSKYTTQHEIVLPGKALYKIGDLQNMMLRAYITSEQLSKLKLGQSVYVYADFGRAATKKYQGEIIWISSKSEFTPKTIQTKDERANLVYAIKIAIPNDGFLKLGMYGNVRLFL